MIFTTKFSNQKIEFSDEEECLELERKQATKYAEDRLLEWQPGPWGLDVLAPSIAARMGNLTTCQNKENGKAYLHVTGSIFEGDYHPQKIGIYSVYVPLNPNQKSGLFSHCLTFNNSGELQGTDCVIWIDDDQREDAKTWDICSLYLTPQLLTLKLKKSRILCYN